MTTYLYGLPSSADVEGLTGKEILRAIIEGRLPQSADLAADDFLDH